MMIPTHARSANTTPITGSKPDDSPDPDPVWFTFSVTGDVIVLVTTGVVVIEAMAGAVVGSVVDAGADTTI